ncbi:MAG TPA: hypothetical protein VFZ65_03690 [Planctomycetota bacterium]|nr:hypothetical protein [Planctomycetota bacterium]
MTARPSLLLLVLASTGALVAQDYPMSIPVNVTAEVDTTQLATAGRALLKLRFVSEATPDRAFAVRIELRRGGRLLLRRDHAPPVPTLQWVKDKVVAYELPLTFVLPDDTNLSPGNVEVHLGLLDPATDKVAPPLSRSIGADGLARLCAFELPAIEGSIDAAAVDAVIAAANAEKQPQDAWDRLEFAFRRLEDYPLKARLQKALLAVGRTPPRPLTFEESDIVQGRIRDERARYLRQVAGRMFDRGKSYGAILLLDEVGGALQEDADRAVLGALGDARRVTQDRDNIAARIFALSKEQEAEVAQLVERYPNGKERLEAGVKLAKNPAQRAVGRELVRTLEFLLETRGQGEKARAAIEAAWLADVPADERAEANAALSHPCWARTATRSSHRFVFIGPKQLVSGIPDDSLLHFDLAYLYLTDLFGRVPNPDGDRVTVYFKELWEFGGGVGGGKIIDVGNADPEAKALRVDNGLLYHELTHCIDDTAPIYGGMHEGLADFGATFAQQELGQVAGARAAFGLAARAFLEDYLERDLEYWRIPNYGPSAGFFLHFISTYGKDGNGYRWQLYRKFFRDYRACNVKDARTPDVARAFAFHLVQAFGKDAFADLVRFRWPLLEQDLEAVRLEQIAASGRQLGPTLEDQPGSPVPRDRAAKRLYDRSKQPDAYHEDLGVVTDWWVIGPFRKQGVDPADYRFPPELEIDLQARYESINNNPTWRRPGPKPVTVDATGWLHFDFSYMDDSAIYALTHVRVETETEAWLHVRADDDLILFVNDELVGAHDFGNGPFGPWRPNWRALLPDAIRFAVTLHKGRNKVLLKIRNRAGASGCSLAIAQRNGTPLPGWTTDADPPAKKLAAIDVPDAKRWASLLHLRFDGGGGVRKLDDTVGKWRSRNGALEGFATDRQVEWRKYTVRPGFPKDSPSNLAWLPERATEQLDAFQLALDLEPGQGPPKLCVILQGEGRRDALSGWTLILEPVGGDAVRAHLERYDRRCYMSDQVPWQSDAKKAAKNGGRLELLYWAQRLTVRLGGAVLFDQAPLQPIPGKNRIGLATWGEALRIEGLELRAPARTR